MADESDTAPTPTASKREESGGLGGEDESAEPSTPAPRASGPRRSSKRPVVPVMDPESNLSPTVARSRKRQAIAGDRAGGGGAETEEDAFAKDREIKRLQQDLNEQKMVVKKGRQMLAQSLVELAKNEREKIRTKLCHDGLRLGKYKTSTFGQSDAWEGGSEEEQIKQLKKMLHEERNSVEQTRRSLKSQTKKEKEEGQTKKIEKEEDEPKEANEEDDTMEVREVCAHRLEYIKREDLQIKERESRLSAERTVHQKQRMLVNAEDRSRFRHYAILKDKYQLLNMIGRGGFSEIWKAFDLDQMCFCAIKINEIEAKMTDAQRQDLVRWALREYEIQKKLQHPRIVQLRDCFALDNHAFVLVLELCEGETLDLRLKTLGPLPEKEAKSIIVQMLSGLRYLNSSGRKIIHYDIKPSNLFYHAGQVKIGDFGLSKMADTPHPEGVIDLSTRGAGTSWYLPPECHEIASPTINSKVDVWSTGVVFFELLFGRRPFGEGQSQDAFRREGSFDLTVPTAPRVSNEAKEFLKRLLIRDRDQRPDVHEALQDPYIRPVKANDTRR